VQAIGKGSGDFAEISFEERAERLNHLFMDKIVPFYREVIQMSLAAQYDELLTHYKAQEMQLRCDKSFSIKKKFELITREYDQQNKTFDAKHRQIAAEEDLRKQDIISNFETHISSIREQMKEENENLAIEECKADTA
jgi:hypothetical protein